MTPIVTLTLETDTHRIGPQVLAVEAAVLALLHHCSPVFLGKLKRDEIGRVQRKLAGRLPTRATGDQHEGEERDDDD